MYTSYSEVLYYSRFHILYLGFRNMLSPSKCLGKYLKFLSSQSIPYTQYHSCSCFHPFNIRCSSSVNSGKRWWRWLHLLSDFTYISIWIFFDSHTQTSTCSGGKLNWTNNKRIHFAFSSESLKKAAEGAPASGETALLDKYEVLSGDQSISCRLIYASLQQSCK